MIGEPIDAGVRAVRVLPAGAGHVAPPLGPDDTARRRKVVRQLPGEDERRAIAFRVGDVPGGGDELAEPAIADAHALDRERLDRRLPDGPLGVLRVGPRVLSPHPEGLRGKPDEQLLAPAGPLPAQTTHGTTVTHRSRIRDSSGGPERAWCQGSIACSVCSNIGVTMKPPSGASWAGSSIVKSEMIAVNGLSDGRSSGVSWVISSIRIVSPLWNV
jgi:hypothetical protein